MHAYLFGLLTVVASTLPALPVLAEPLSAPVTERTIMLSFGTGMSALEEPFGLVPGSINTRVGGFVIPEVAINGGLDLTHTGVASSNDGKDQADESYLLLTLHAGAKFYFLPRGEGNVTIYDQFSLFTMIPIVNSESRSLEDTADDSFSVGILNGVGAEYFFADAFSVGAEFGLNIFIVGYDQDKFTLRADVVDLYTGFTLNFYL